MTQLEQSCVTLFIRDYQNISLKIELLEKHRDELIDRIERDQEDLVDVSNELGMLKTQKEFIVTRFANATFHGLETKLQKQSQKKLPTTDGTK